MSTYMAPLRDMRFVMTELAGIGELSALPGFEDVTPELAEAVLDEAAKLATEVLAPLNKSGDEQGARLTKDGVVAADGFAKAYRQFIAGGWSGLSGDPEFGGQGLPELLQAATVEMWNSSNMAFALCPLLTAGATEALRQHGSEELKGRYLPNLVSGEWTGTMNLTEPQAGSDLAAVRTKAVPEGDHYRIFGQKIFITWGDHDMTDNVIHLVLARTPDAPEGVRGISLFVVPKFLLNDDGSAGERNDVHCVSLEHKLGIHASPTCVMSFGDQGGAIGYLVGQENKGLAHMFTMMNEARQKVGIQGLAMAERRDAVMRKPVDVRDYTDFYASIFHATHVGRLFRPENPLLPNYKFVPIGYHGRASSVLVSGATVRRPAGQIVSAPGAAPHLAPSQALDYEVEAGFFIGPGNGLGEPIAMERAASHLFGMCLVNDWSARDILPTLTQIGFAQTPENIEGHSILPTLLGKETNNQP